MWSSASSLAHTVGRRIVEEQRKMEPKPEVLLIDLSSLAHQTYHVSGTEIDPDYVSKTVVGRIHTMASGVDHVGVCCDSGRSFRHDISDSYKANRTVDDEKRAVLGHQIKLIREQLAADGIAVYEAKGYEADDVIGTATKAARAAGHPVLIVTGDKDLSQLVTDEAPAVRCKSVQTGNAIDTAGVVAKLGVAPWQVVDYLSLVGDSSDNIKGAVGIGEKTARELLKQFGSLDDLYRVMDSVGLKSSGVTQAKAASLRMFRDRLDHVRTLVRLADVPDLDLSGLLAPRVIPLMTEEPEPVTKDEQKDADIAYIFGEDEPPTPPATITTTTPTPEQPVAAVVPQSQALARVVNAEVVPFERQLEPRDSAGAIALSDRMFKSRMFSGYGSPEAVLATVMAGRELGLQAIASLRGFHIVEGKPTLAADLIRALVIKSGQARYFRCVERTEKKATFTTARKDDPQHEISLSFSVDEAKAAQLGGWDGNKFKPGSGWAKSPADQCVARASAKLARLAYPEVVFGLYDPSELAD